MVSPAGPGTGGRGRPARPLLRTTLGDVLRRIRRAQGRTLADVARTAKVSLPYLSELERGRKEASSEVLAAICAALRVELADLLAETGRLLAGAPGPRLTGDPDRRLISAPGRHLADDQGRRLADGRGRQASGGEVVRLDDIRGRRNQPAPQIQDPADVARPGPASDDARCLLAV